MRAGVNRFVHDAWRSEYLGGIDVLVREAEVPRLPFLEQSNSIEYTKPALD